MAPKTSMKKAKSHVKKIIAAKISAFLIPVVAVLLIIVVIVSFMVAIIYQQNKWIIDTYQTASHAYKTVVEFFTGKEPSPKVPSEILAILYPLEKQHNIPWVFVYAISVQTNNNDYEQICHDLNAYGFADDWKTALNTYGQNLAAESGNVQSEEPGQDSETEIASFSDLIINSLGDYLNTPPLMYPMPLNKGIVTEEQGTERKRDDGSIYHHGGIDVADAKGTPIYAAHSGTVVGNDYSNSAGYYVTLRTKDKTIKTRYLHLMEKSPLKVGQKVTVGDYIGSMGATGDVTGVHLHFEVIKGNKQQNPREYVFFPRTREGSHIGLDRTQTPTSNMRAK